MLKSLLFRRKTQGVDARYPIGFNAGMKNNIKTVVALEGRPLPPLSQEERSVYAVLSENKGRALSPLGLTRWIKKKPDAAKADKKIAAAAQKLWQGTLISQDEDGNYFVG